MGNPCVIRCSPHPRRLRTGVLSIEKTGHLASTDYVHSWSGESLRSFPITLLLLPAEAGAFLCVSPEMSSRLSFSSLAGKLRCFSLINQSDVMMTSENTHRDYCARKALGSLTTLVGKGRREVKARKTFFAHLFEPLLCSSGPDIRRHLCRNIRSLAQVYQWSIQSGTGRFCGKRKKSVESISAPFR